MDMREVLGASKWFLAADLQTVTLSSDQQCVTFVVHFMGACPDPDRPKKLPYRTCGSLEEETLLEEYKSESWGWEGRGEYKVTYPQSLCIPNPFAEVSYQVFSFAANTPWDLKGGVAGAGLASALLLPLLHLIACDKPINIKASWFSRPSPPPLVPLTLHRGPVHYVDRRL
ncbi:hypothetical protein O3P69_018348 [Scylla paramamosain]|uniref:Uncharacterized protein n=1 Tax=Scylla paramamosain TaxID=85552 RepID=A0AAW0SF26_SCYPA